MKAQYNRLKALGEILFLTTLTYCALTAILSIYVRQNPLANDVILPNFLLPAWLALAIVVVSGILCKLLSWPSHLKANPWSFTAIIGLTGLVAVAILFWTH